MLSLRVNDVYELPEEVKIMEKSVKEVWEV